MTGFIIFRDERHDAYHMFHLDGHYDPSCGMWPALFLDVPYRPDEDEDGPDVFYEAGTGFDWSASWPLDQTVRIDYVQSICSTPWLSERRLSGWSGVRFAFACSVVRSAARAAVRE
jgi:hypothetical protein